MNEKLSFQNITDKLAQESGVSKKMAETFSKAFFDTIVETLSTGDSIKIKGLGTFKLVEVGDRESVNVSTGMRFVIPGYKKVAFTAEDSVVEELNARTEAPASDSTETPVEVEVSEPVAAEVPEEAPVEEVPVVEEEVPVVEEEAPVVEEVPVEVEKEEDIDTLIQVPEPEQVEQPQDAFAGIDMLISTPESMEEIRQQYEEAKAKLETAVEEARKANAEKLRLERLLERMEKNVEPEMVAHTERAEVQNTDDSADTAQEENSNKIEAVDKTDTTDEEAKRQEAFNRVMMEQPKQQEPEPPSEKTSNRNVWMTLLVIFLVAVLGVFVYMIYRNIEAVEKVPTEQAVKPAQPVKPSKPVQPKKPAQPTQPATPKVEKDSLAKAQKADSIKASKVEAPKPQKEATQPNVQKPEVKKQDAKKPDTKKQDTKKPVEVKKPEEKKPERPKTHRMQRGESLTRISQKYYGTKDSVRAILRINTFANPDNIPVGAVVKLP